MVLFVALLVNSTYLQYFQADELNSRNDNKRVRDAEFSRERGAILVAGNSVAQSKPSNDQFKFQRVYPQPEKYAHLTGYYSYTYGRNAVELTQNDILSGSDPRLFVNRVVDLFGNSQPKGGDVSLTIDPKAQNAAYDGLQALGKDVKGSVVALDPSTGAIQAMVSQPVVRPERAVLAQPSTISSCLGEADRRPRPADAQPRHPGGATRRARPSSWSPRRRRCRAGSTTPTRWSRAAPASTSRRPTPTCPTRAAPTAAATRSP